MTDYCFRPNLNQLKCKCVGILIGFFILLFPNILFAQNNYVTLPEKQVTVSQACDAISKQLQYDVFYSSSEMNPRRLLSLNKTKATLVEVLNAIADGKYQYSIKDKTITIRLLTRNNQPPTIKRVLGVVKDEDGLPLPGATIKVKNHPIGGVTDVNGRYDIKLQQNIDNPTLRISFIGMEPVEIVAGNNASVVVLKNNTNKINEVIITGYEVVDKRKSTSSVVSVNLDKIKEPAITSIDNMLQGKIAGMTVMQQSSAVGAAPKIRIRGSSTITGNREPLWVVDGIVLDDPVPLSNEQLNSMDNVNLIGNAISGLNPEDIDRIDVLKDASATALYGTKAANGVIVVTTKRGKMGKPAITYVNNTQVKERPEVGDMYRMNSLQRIELSEEMHARGIALPGPSLGDIGYEGLLSQLYRGNIDDQEFSMGVKKLKEMNTDWFKMLFRNSLSQSHTLSISGANDVINYYMSLGYADDQGTQMKESGNRYNATSNLDIRLTKKLRVGLNLNFSNQETKRPHGSIDLFSYAYKASRAISPYNEDGSLFFYNNQYFTYGNILKGSDYLKYNIIDELNQTGQKSNIYTVNTKVNLSYAIWDNLKFEAVGAFNASNTNMESYASEYSYFVASKFRKFQGPLPSNASTVADYTGTAGSIIPYGGYADGSNYRNKNVTGRATLGYNKQIKKHFVSAMIGTELKTSKNLGNTYKVLGFYPDRGLKAAIIDPTIWKAYANELQKSQPTFTDRTTNNVSFFGTTAYSYDDKYTFSANFRTDASNKLGQSKATRFLPIWSVSGKWNIEREDVFENTHWLNEWSIRASYGLQGNVSDAHNPNMIVSFGEFDAIPQEYVLNLSSLPNTNLRWEKTSSYNFGTDVSLFNSRIRFSLDYYYKLGKDQLVSAPIDPTNGAKSMVINYGNLINEGWDLSFSATPIRTADFSWNLTLTTGKVKNRVTNAGISDLNKESLGAYLNGTVVRNGNSLNSFYSYDFTGLDVQGYPTYNGIKLRDSEGNIVITSREEAFAKGLKYSGRREPDFQGGLNSSFSYKNITVNALFAAQFGSKIRLNPLYGTVPSFVPFENASVELLDRWRKPGDESFTNIPTVVSDDILIKNMKGEYEVYKEGGNPVIGNGLYEMYNYSDIRVVSGDFFRCRSISLSYRLESDWVKKVKLRGATLSFSMSNPFVIASKELKGRDPEQVASGGTIPPLKSYSFTFNVTL